MPTFKVKFNRTKNWVYVVLDRVPMSCGCEGDLFEWLIDSHTGGYHEGEDWKVEAVREVHAERLIGVAQIRLFYETRSYGGPEEGGWYRHGENTKRTFWVPVKQQERWAERLRRYCERVNEGLPRWDTESRLMVATWEESDYGPHHYC